jgi:hypothetical protein
MHIEIWHTAPRVLGDNVRRLLDSDDLARAENILWGDDPELIYRLVGFVDLPESMTPQGTWTKGNTEACLDHAYAMTQNISQSWARNTGVRCRLEPCRSTSVGDMLVFGEERWVVARFGFTQLRF